MKTHLIGTAGSVLQGWLVVPCQVDLFGGDPFDEATVGLATIYEKVGELLEVIILLLSVGILVRIVISLMSGDKDSAKKLLWWVAGLAGGLAILEILM